MPRKTTAMLRAEYKTVRGLFCYDNCTPIEFDEIIRAKGPTKASQWVRFAKSAACRCGRCAGTGKFVVGTVNGQPNMPGGDCYRCSGKGYQVADDVARNRTFDRHNVERLAASRAA